MDWVAVRLDKKTDWDEIRSLPVQGYRMVAPKRALVQLDASPPTRKRGTKR